MDRQAKCIDRTSNRTRFPEPKYLGAWEWVLVWHWFALGIGMPSPIARGKAVHKGTSVLHNSPGFQLHFISLPRRYLTLIGKPGSNNLCTWGHLREHPTPLYDPSIIPSLEYILTLVTILKGYNFIFLILNVILAVSLGVMGF
jgi:hypothetical protein